MKAIEKPIEWYQSKKGHCDALIKDIVLLGNKGDGEYKEERSQLEETFIEDMENLKVHLGRLKAKGDLPSKLAEAIKVLAMVAKWGIGNNDDIIKVIENIKNSLEEQARSAKEEDIQPSLELLEKQAPLKNTIAVINFKQIKGILTRRVKEQAKNKNELSISLEKNQKSVYEIKSLRFLIAEFLEDVRDKIIFLFRLNKALAIDSKITGNLNLYRYRKVVTSSVFKDLMNKTVRLKEVSLSRCKQPVNNDIKAWVKQNTSITSLNLSYTKITHEGLELLAPSLGSLTLLDLGYTNITDKGLSELAPHLGNLTRLDLCACRQITDEGLTALAKTCRNLTSLDLRNTRITNEGLELLAPSLGNLTCLDLSWCRQITDEGLELLAPSLENLTSLNLGECQQITDKGLRALAENCKNLIRVDLFCTNITYKGLKALAKACRNLTSLDLHGCQLADQWLGLLARSLWNLTELSLRGNEITDEGVKELAYIENLTSLNLSRCKNITDEGLKSLTPHLGKLTSLNLYGCRQITDEGFKALAPYLLENLTNLDFSDTKINDEGLKAVAENCRNLTRLNLQYTRITDKGLKSLIPHLGNLTSLNWRSGVRIMTGEDYLDKIKAEIEQGERDNSFSFPQRKENTCDRLKRCVLQ